MSTLKTILKLAVLTVVLVWVWTLLEFEVQGDRLVLLHLGITAAGFVLAGTIIAGHDGGFKATMGLYYALTFGVMIALNEGYSSDRGVLRMVHVEVDDTLVLSLAEAITRDQYEYQTLFESLMARNAVPYDLELATVEDVAVQTVGRSQFSPMDLAGN